MLESLQAIVDEMLSDKERQLGDIKAITKRQEKMLLETFNQTEAEEVDMSKSVSVLLNTAMKQYSKRKALVFKEKVLTYEELDRRVEIFSKRLQTAGVKRQEIVAVILEPSLEMIVSILGILRIGAIFLPMAHNTPAERVHTILKESGCRLVVTGKTKEKTGIENVTSISVEDIDWEQPIGEKQAYESVDTKEIAYVIYTSGSTGVPNGVMVSHRALANLIYWHNRQYGVTCEDVSTKYAGFGFDASVWEIFPYLAAGSCLHILEEEMRMDLKKLAAYFEENRVSIAFLPTQICEQFMSYENHSLRYLLTGGDKLNYFKKNNYKLINNYGPTENAVVTSFYEVTEASSNIPIGKPVDRVQLYVLDKQNQLVPPGAKGELLIAGNSLAEGYLHNQKLTAEKFIPHPFVNGATAYKSGDIVRWDEYGNLRFIGRNDSQVKIRGNRVEMGEIKTAIQGYEGVTQVVVVIREVRANKVICAYYCASREIEAVQLKKFARKFLPSYMVPSYFVQMKEIPLTVNGKVDYRRLPEPQLEELEAEERAVSDVQIQLLHIWKELLKTEEIGIYDNFMEIGGDSILIIRMHKEIEKQYPGVISVADIFASPTIADLAEYIEDKQKEVEFSCEQITIPKAFYPSRKRTIGRRKFRRKVRINTSTTKETHETFLFLYAFMMFRLTDQQEVSLLGCKDSKYYIVHLEKQAGMHANALMKEVEKAYSKADKAAKPKIVVESREKGILPVFLYQEESSEYYKKFADMAFYVEDRAGEIILEVELFHKDITEEFANGILMQYEQILRTIFKG